MRELTARPRDPRRAERRARQAALRERARGDGDRRSLARGRPPAGACASTSSRCPRRRRRGAHAAAADRRGGHALARRARRSPRRARSRAGSAARRPPSSRATEAHQVVANVAAWTDPARLAATRSSRAFHDGRRQARADAHVDADARRVGPGAGGDAQGAPRRGRRRPRLPEGERRFEDALQPRSAAAVARAARHRRRPPRARRRLLRGAPRAPAGLQRAPRARRARAYRYVAHAAVVVFVLVVLPLAAGALTSLFAGTRSDPRYVGLGNYVAILTARGGPLLGHESFYLTLARDRPLDGVQRRAAPGDRRRPRRRPLAAGDEAQVGLPRASRPSVGRARAT